MQICANKLSEIQVHHTLLRISQYNPINNLNCLIEARSTTVSPWNNILNLFPVQS